MLQLKDKTELTSFNGGFASRFSFWGRLSSSLSLSFFFFFFFLLSVPSPCGGDLESDCDGRLFFLGPPPPPPLECSPSELLLRFSP